MVNHYWDFCDTKKAFSSRDKMAQAFDTYLSFMPYASHDTIIDSVDKFMKRIEKQPRDVLFIGELAEAKLYSDTSELQSDELYLRFAEAIINNKKVDKTAKLRYQHQAKILKNSQIGMIAPNFDYTDRTGNTTTFSADTSRMATIIFFNDPDCSECSLARIRLDANIHTNQLIESGVVDIYSITPTEASAEWVDSVSRFPESWHVGACELIDEIYDLRTSPSFYVLDSEGKILLKNADTDLILNILSQLRVPKIKKHNTSDSE